MNIKMIVYNSNGEITFTERNVSSVYERLAHDLIAKKMHKCLYIRRITERNLYTGYREITVYEDNGFKAVYTIKF